jgi:hypothetical protein
MRDIRIPPRLWWGVWLLWSAVLMERNFASFLDRAAGLPHNTMCGPISAAVYALLTAVTAAVVWRSVDMFLHPRKADDDG